MTIYRGLLPALALAALIAPLAASAASKDAGPSYSYNRISEDLTVRPDGTVDIAELLTMVYDGSYHSMWEVLPASTSTMVSEVAVADGSTGEPFTYSATRLDPGDPENWGRYTTFEDEWGRTNVEWYYGTRDRVHTWRLSYAVRGAVDFLPAYDRLSWDIFGSYGVPVGTVEATVRLPGAITAPQASIYTSGGHDYYIDRPDRQTYRFRVSDIAPGERASIGVAWQKGLVSPRIDYRRAMALWLAIPLVRYGLLALAALLASCSALYVYMRGPGRLAGAAGRVAAAWARLWG